MRGLGIRFVLESVLLVPEEPDILGAKGWGAYLPAIMDGSCGAAKVRSDRLESTRRAE